MPVDNKVMSSVKAKLDAMTNQTKKQTLIFRPPRGQEVQLRIIPYKHGPDPFNELYFHYDIGPVKSIICPRSVNSTEKCPICEYGSYLVQEKNDKNFALWKRLKSRLRVYIPVLVRSQETEGVKFWGIGKNTYTAIAQLFIDPEYGDISDPIKGRDIKVLATAPTPQFIYGQVQVRPAANPSGLSLDTKVAKDLIMNCPNVFDAFTKMSTDEIKQALDAFVAEGDKSETAQAEAPVAEVDDEATEDLSELNEMFEQIKNK
jgi:hypothetical protein